MPQYVAQMSSSNSRPGAGRVNNFNVGGGGDLSMSQDAAQLSGGGGGMPNMNGMANLGVLGMNGMPGNIGSSAGFGLDMVDNNFMAMTAGQNPGLNNFSSFAGVDVSGMLGGMNGFAEGAAGGALDNGTNMGYGGYAA